MKVYNRRKATSCVSFHSYLFLFVNCVSFLSQVSDDSGCECRWKRNIQGSKETNVKGVSDIHGSKETCLDQIGHVRRGASSGSDRNDEDKKETCYVKRNMKVKYVIRSEESNILCFFWFVSISFRGLCFFSFLGEWWQQMRMQVEKKHSRIKRNEREGSKWHSRGQKKHAWIWSDHLGEEEHCVDRTGTTKTKKKHAMSKETWR